MISAEEIKALTNNLDYKAIHKAIYDATLRAIAETGDDYLQLLWFGRNKNMEKYGDKYDR